MSQLSTPPRANENIILSIWYDKENRAKLLQVVSFIAILAFFYFIISNVIDNLNAIGKGFSFSFLDQPANYDINQTFIEYTSRSPHWIAGVNGLINTLLVAISGIFLATILGFFLGVLRLSKNWLTNKIVYCYIEYMRNVPVLIHILIVHGFIIHALPVPKKAEGVLNESVFLTNRGFYVPKPIFESAFIFTLIAFAIAVVFCFLFSRYAKRVQNETGKHYPVFWICTAAVIGLPLLVFLLSGIPATLDSPTLGKFNISGGLVVRPEFTALTLALSLYTAAFIAEIVRAGILAINKGQTEAAFALGIKPSRTMNLVIIPQALRVIIPPLTSQYLNLTKNSSLALAIGYMDIVATIGGISLNQTGREMECMIIVLLIYLALSLSISALMNYFNSRIKLVER